MRLENIKRVCIAYRGVYNFKKIINGVDDKLFNELKENCENHKKNIFDFFDGCDIDIYFSTYDLNNEVNEFYKNELNPVFYGYIETSFNPHHRWIVHLKHCKNLISNIRLHMERSRNHYDTIIFTRPDVRMLQNFSELNLDFSKFNIVLEHLSGNCDDNIFVFPANCLDSFEKSIDELYSKNRITHEINHQLKSRGCEINYLVGYDGTDMGHTVFNFCR